MQTIIQIYPCLLKLSRKQESVTDGQTDGQTDGRYYYIPSPLSRGDNNLMRALITFCFHLLFYYDVKHTDDSICQMILTILC